MLFLFCLQSILIAMEIMNFYDLVFSSNQIKRHDSEFLCSLDRSLLFVVVYL